MASPRPRQSPPEQNGFPTKQLATLAICRLAEPIAFTSILSYTYAMVQTFPGINSTSASFYAGLLISAFAVAEACTAMLWGSISDRYGRKPIILLGLAGTAVSSLAFGFARNFWIAFAARIVGGLLNGNVAVMQTMVSEIAYRPEYEPRAYAMPPFMWSFGAIIGAAVGGYLAEPARYYPSMFALDGLFGQYPYLLPNLVAVIAIILAIVQGCVFLKETNPRLQIPQRQDQDGSSSSADEHTPLISRKRRRGSSVTDTISAVSRRPSFVSGSMPSVSEPSFDIRKSSITTIHNIHDVKHTIQHVEDAIEEDDDRKDPAPMKAFNRPVLLWILAVVIMCYHQMAFSSLIPTYFLDSPHTSSTTTSLDLRGGLGYTVHDVGAFMAINGIIALLIQGLIFPVFVSRVGVWKSLVWLILLCPVTSILVPFLSFLPRSSLPYGIYALLALQNFFMIIIYPCLLISLKNATPSPLLLGRVNGLAMSACSGARTIAPPLEGLIYGKGGPAAAWWSIAAVALLGAGQLFLIERPRGDADVVVENVFKGEEDEDVEGG